MELVLWLSLIDHYAHTMVQQSLQQIAGMWFVVCRYELVLWLSTFVTDCLNVVHGLPMIVYMSWGHSTQLAQYSDVCTTTQN